MERDVRLEFQDTRENIRLASINPDFTWTYSPQTGQVPTLRQRHFYS